MDWTDEANDYFDRIMVALEMSPDEIDGTRTVAELCALRLGRDSVDVADVADGSARIRGGIAMTPDREIPDDRPVYIPVTRDALSRVEERLGDLWGTFGTYPEPTESRNRIVGSVETLTDLGFRVLADGRGGFTVEPPAETDGRLTVERAAEELGVSVGRIRQLLNEDNPRLLGEKVGNSWVVDRDSLEDYRRGRRPYRRRGGDVSEPRTI